MKKIISLLLCAAMLLSLTACGEPAPTTAPATTAPPATTTLPALSAQELYDGAVAALASVNDLTLDITVVNSTKAGPDTFTVEITQDLTLSNLVSGEFQGRYTDSADFGGGFIISSEEIISGDTLFGEVSGALYQTPCTREEFLASHLPAPLLDASLYGTMELTGARTIVLTDAIGPEEWLSIGGAQLTEASGTITLTDAGEFSAFTYQASYTQGGVECSVTVESTVSPTGTPLSVPSDPENYPDEENGRYLKTLELAEGYLYQANSVTASITEMVVAQAAGAVMNQQTGVEIFGTGADYLAKVDYNAQINEYSSGANSTYEQDELFREGVYSISTDGGDPVPQSGITSERMQNYCLGIISDNMPDAAFISGVTATDLNGIRLLEYNFTDEYALLLKEYAQSSILTSSTLLDDLASSYRTDAISGYMGIDPFTGLPTSVGISYTGYHTIQGIEYALTLEAHQSLHLGSQSSYKAITEKDLLTGDELAQPTPLFYRVTGSDGEEMWLMGTIHVGDERIANLPQEIWDALDSADALAVEVDIDVFEQQIEEDEALAAQLSEAYFYADGSTTEAHLKDAELYETALKLLKASGGYHFNAPYLKPAFWSQSIENFYLSQGYDLTSEFGVDNQLLARAREQEIEIISIESGLFQTQMTANYSDPLQEMLLASSVETFQWEYIDSVRELFDLWCAGDEDALIEYLRGDLVEVSEEEAALHEEYNKAISTDRNAGMLEAAKEFLESGDVVFYAVGLAHLLAEDGLVFTLRDAGYTVELVTFK